MTRQTRVLSIGADADVLAARNSVLTHAGFRVGIADNRHEAILSAASHEFDIAIICWTFLPDDQSRLLHDLEIVSPRTRVLVLSCPNTPALLPDAADPGLLLQMVRARIA